MAVVRHIWRHEAPLRERLPRQIGIKLGEVLDQTQSRRVARHRLVENERIVLPDVVIRERFLIGPIEPLEARVGRRFLILGPGDALGVEEIDHGADVRGQGVEVVVVHAEVVAANDGRVVGLAGMGGCVVVCQRDALGGEPFLVRIS